MCNPSIASRFKQRNKYQWFSFPFLPTFGKKGFWLSCRPRDEKLFILTPSTPQNEDQENNFAYPYQLPSVRCAVVWVYSK